MYGILLRLDAGRQQRVGSDPLAKLLKPETYAAVKARHAKLNASTDYTSPFAPTLVRPSFYPDYFRATDIRTLFWKVKNMDGLHELKRLYIDKDSRIVFEFGESDTSMSDMGDLLDKALSAMNYFEFTDKQVSGKSISYTVSKGAYPIGEGEGD